jgi:rfaE bifunctional protein nucleotidyltransferase chain/domain
LKNIISISQLNFFKSLSKNIVLVGGCFDILHIGHITFLEEAKKRGEFLVILLESDSKIKQLKGLKRPINPQKTRARILSSLKFVDCVILLPENLKDSDYDLIVQKINPKIIAVSAQDSGIQHKQRSAKLVGAKVVKVTKKIKELSTSNLLKLLNHT